MYDYKNTGGKQAYPVLIQDSPTDISQVIVNKVLVSPINVVNSDNAGVWGYTFTSTAPKTITNSSAVTKVAITGGAWSTVEGVDLTSLLK